MLLGKHGANHSKFHLTKYRQSYSKIKKLRHTKNMLYLYKRGYNEQEKCY